ncbi:MAG TPA: hypothetical protein VGO57_10960 [Verrucomicrobiae bacterium]
MKITFFSFMILIVVAGCSKETTDNKNDSSLQKQQTSQGLIPTNPNEITLIESAVRKEWLEIAAKSAALFAAKDFDKLEELANQYRTSKECFDTGIWKLEAVYFGIVPSSDKSDEEWKMSLATLHDWIRTKPNSITARVALAGTLVDYGWKARGSDYAKNVSDTGWKLLGERLSEAVQVLKQAGNLSEKCPHYWTVMLEAAMGLSANKSQYETLFQKAIASEPDFTGYYCQKAYYLSPRWGGQPGDMEVFLEGAANQVGGENGDLLYARVAWYVQLLTRDVFDDHGLSWERTDKGFEVLEKLYPNSIHVQNGRAYMAVMGCEKTLAPRRLILALHGQIDPKDWTSKENFIRLTHTYNP